MYVFLEDESLARFLNEVDDCEECCAKCRFWKQDAPPGRKIRNGIEYLVEYNGMCRRFPPLVPFQNPDVLNDCFPLEAQQPLTEWDSWCGEFVKGRP